MFYGERIFLPHSDQQTAIKNVTTATLSNWKALIMDYIESKWQDDQDWTLE